MSKQDALKLRRNDTVTRKYDGQCILVACVWVIGKIVFIKGWTDMDDVVPVTHLEVR